MLLLLLPEDWFCDEDDCEDFEVSSLIITSPLSSESEFSEEDSLDDSLVFSADESDSFFSSSEISSLLFSESTTCFSLVVTDSE